MAEVSGNGVPLPWAGQHALDNPGHVTTQSIGEPAECQTCGEKEPIAGLLHIPDIPEGQRPEDIHADLRRLFITACDDPGNVATHAPRGGIQFEQQYDPSEDDLRNDMITLGWTPEPVTVEFTLAEPDPDLLGLLTGGVMGNPPEPTFSMEVHGQTPVRRKWWEWLLRRPRRYTDYHIYIPRAKMADRTTDDE